jgi:glutamine amidotransferase
MRVRSTDLASCDSVVLATERMDEHPGWRLLEPGELLRVPRTLRCSSIVPLTGEPVHRLTITQLDSRAAASQTVERIPAPAGPAT